MSVDEKEGGLPGIEAFRGEDCLDFATLGLFAEGRLPGQKRAAAADHLLACPYCLKQLNDMMEMLYYEKLPKRLSPRLAWRLRRLCPEAAEKKPRGRLRQKLVERVKAAARSLFGRWRYGAVGLAGALVVVVACLSFVLRPAPPTPAASRVDARSFVNVQALDDEGRVVSATKGVVVDSGGFLALSLHPLAGGSVIQVTLKDGRTYRTASVWRDEDRDLAVMKIDNESLPSMPVGDIDRVVVGQTVLLVPDRFPSDRRFKESVVRALSAVPGRRKGRPVRYIQLATAGATDAGGTIIDSEGRLLGLVIAQEKGTNVAVPVGDAARLAHEGRAVPVAELKGVKFSHEALNLYMKGILARDGEQWDESIDCLKKAVGLNPNLAGARMELAYAYYKKGLYDMEKGEYEEVLKIDPQHADALFSLAMCLQMKGEYRAAIEKYQKILAADPKDAEAQYQIGLAQIALGNKKKAMAACDRLKTLDAGSAEMLRRLIGRQY
jgi:S1-C subfamily serine protease